MHDLVDGEGGTEDIYNNESSPIVTFYHHVAMSAPVGLSLFGNGRGGVGEGYPSLYLQCPSDGTEHPATLKLAERQRIGDRPVTSS